jgi:hypothetical protein
MLDYGLETLAHTIAKPIKERYNMHTRYQADVQFDTADGRQPQLVVSVPPDQADSIREALARLASRWPSGAFVQDVILDAVRAAAEQTYFWTPAWQEKERAADLAVAEGRIRTFDTVNEMIDFLDEQ